MKKKVLIISYSYPPSNAPAAQRPYAIAKYLDKSRYDVTVLSCSNQDSSLGFDPSKDNSLKGVKHIEIPALFGSKMKGVRSESPGKSKKPSLKGKLMVFLKHSFGLFMIPDKAVLWVYNVKKALANKSLVVNADLIISTSPLFSNHLLAKYIVKQNPGVKWIADFRDFHFIKRIDKIPWYLRGIQKSHEAGIIQAATTVTFISNSMKEIYESSYSKEASKFRVVYNGFDFEEYQGVEIKDNENEKLLSIVYAGSFHAGERNPKPLFAVLDKALESGVLVLSELEIRIAGNISVKEIETISKYSSFAAVNFLELMPRSEIYKLYQETTLLWLIVGERITHYTGVPIKFYEYMASRRPIINFAPENAEVSSMIDTSSLGWNFGLKDCDLDENYGKMLSIIQSFRSKNLLKSLPEKNLKLYDRREQTKYFEQLIEE